MTKYLCSIRQIECLKKDLQPSCASVNPNFQTPKSKKKVPKVSKHGHQKKSSTLNTSTAMCQV